MQEILFPAATAASLIFAGILVGYLLWYRDRAAHIALGQRLAIEKKQIAAELSKSQTQLADLESQLDFRGDRQSQLQQLCDDLLASRERAQRHGSEVERELYETRRRLEQVREQLAAECGLRNETEEQLHEARQHHLESVAGIQRQWQAKIRQSQAIAGQREQELALELAAREQTVKQLHQASADNAELKSELDAQRQLLEIAKKNAAGLEQEYVSLESTMRSQIELLNEARGQAASENSARKVAEQSLDACRGQLQDLQQELHQMDGLKATLESFKSKCGTLEEAIENERSRARSLTTERNRALAQSEQAHNAMLGYRKRSENQEATIRQLRHHLEYSNETKLKQALGEKQELLQHHQNLKRQLAASENLIQTQDKRLEQAVEENADLRMELDELKQKLVDVSEQARVRMNSLLQQRDQAFEQNSELADELNRVRHQSRANERTIRNLRRERGAVLLRNRQSEHSFPRIHQDVAENTSAAESLAQEYGGIAKCDPQRGIVFTVPPQIRDDLKRIHGVGAVLEKRLNEFGIYTFKQVMLWNNGAVDKFSDLLIFKDRIIRDDWMGQAATLYHHDRRNRVA